MTRLLSIQFALILAALALTHASLAQGGKIPLPDDGDEGSKNGVSKEDLEDYVTREELIERLDKEKNQRRGIATGVAGLDISIGGALEGELRGAQRQHRVGGRYPAPFEDHRGIYLDKASIFAEVSYKDETNHSDFPLLKGRIEFEFNGDDVVLDEGYVLFNRPITRFNYPPLKENFSDSLLLGLEDPFFHNLHRVSESYSLLGESLYRDERMQLLYTLTFKKRYYLIAGLSGGSRLDLKGQVDRTDNFAILQDDRDGYFNGLGTAGEISDRLETQLGFGAVFDLGDRGPVMHMKRPFRPMEVTMQQDVLHIGAWATWDRLSQAESDLIADLTSNPDDSQTKFRAGGAIDLVKAWGYHTIYARGEVAFAKDASFKRTFFTLESSIAFDMGDLMPILMTVQPFLRFSSMTTNKEPPVLNAGDSHTAAAVRGAWMAADRTQLTGGVRLALHRHVALVVEYTMNGETFNTPPGVDDSVDNDVWLLNLKVGF